MKTCNTCGVETDEFWSRNARCIPCTRAHRKERRNNPATREKVLEQDRRYHLKHNYGITPEEYDKMLMEQGGVCAMCKKDDPKHYHDRLVVDHNHKTGEVRSLLCNPCNTLIGLANEDVDLLMTAAAYLMTSTDILAVE